MPNLLILGAGGFGRMIYENVQSTRQFDKIAMLDDAAKGPEVIGKLVDYTTLREEYPCAVAAFGNNKLRVQWVDRLLEAGFVVPTIIHPSAVVSPSAVVGAGSFVMQRAVVNTHTVLVENGDEDTIAALEADGWSAWVDNVSLPESASVSYCASYILRSVDAKRSLAYITLDDDTRSAQVLDHILPDLREDGYTFRLAVGEALDW